MVQNKVKILDMLNKARYYHNYLHDEEKAIKICNKILNQDSDNRDALLIKAGSLQCLNKEKESYKLIEKIIKKWPDHWEAYYILGLLLFNTNEERAVKSLKKSISFKKSFDNLITLAQLLYFLEDANYKNYLDEAKKIDSKRFGIYMKNYWEYEIL